MEAPFIHTARVRLRALRSDDFGAFAELVGDGKVMRFVGGGDGLTSAEAEELFIDLLEEWARRGYGHWAMEDRRDGEFLGYVGLLEYDTKVVEVECFVKASRWRRGFATEATRAVMLYAFDSLHMNRVVGEMHPANRAGQRLMETIGMRHREDNQDNRGLKMYVFAMTAIERRLLSR